MEPQVHCCLAMQIHGKEITVKGTPLVPLWNGQPWAHALAVLVILYLFWLLVAPFLPAIAWAFALALIAHPVHERIQKRLRHKNLATTISVVFVGLVVVAPVIFVSTILVQEAAQGAVMLAKPEALTKIRETLDHRTAIGPLLGWIDARVDLAKETVTTARGLISWIYRLMSSIVSGSAWGVTQIVTMFILLFYFLRDGTVIARNLASILPLNEREKERIVRRIAETIRVSLYGKVTVAAIQGSLGGLIFWWLALPAPAFWGFVMGLLSVLPVLGAFVIWLPAAIVLALQGFWMKAVLLTAWGFLIVHPIDNFLGPVLVGNRLQLHTLLIFISVLGGMAAFGASGIVLGPVIVAIAIALFEARQENQDPDNNSLVPLLGNRSHPLES